MHEQKDFVDSWQFRTVMVGAATAALGIVICFVGICIRSETWCTVGVPLLYAGDAVGFFGIAAGTLTLGWSWMKRIWARDRQ